MHRNIYHIYLLQYYSLEKSYRWRLCSHSWRQYWNFSMVVGLDIYRNNKAIPFVRRSLYSSDRSPNLFLRLATLFENQLINVKSPLLAVKYQSDLMKFFTFKSFFSVSQPEHVFVFYSDLNIQIYLQPSKSWCLG